MGFRTPEVLFFDAAGTLIELSHTVGCHYARVAASHGFISNSERFDMAFRDVWKEMPLRPPTTTARHDDDRPWWRTLVSNTFERIELIPTGEKFDRCFAELYEHFARPGVWRLFPEVEEVLPRLSKAYRLAVISNFDGRLRKILTDLKTSEYFERIVVSSEAGADKPHPEIFEAALQAMQVRPEHAMHIGDDPVLDWQAAKAAGIPVFELDRPQNSLRDLALYLSSTR
jgi:putative hydrolase of the HAD superfamily